MSKSLLGSAQLEGMEGCGGGEVFRVGRIAEGEVWQWLDEAWRGDGVFKTLFQTHNPGSVGRTLVSVCLPAYISSKPKIRTFFFFYPYQHGTTRALTTGRWCSSQRKTPRPWYVLSPPFVLFTHTHTGPNMCLTDRAACWWMRRRFLPCFPSTASSISASGGRSSRRR